ncbi:MAG TPA: aldo/keto reductase [Candidatus Thermoplasmatota archaeon]|nr:aldo/keto reductase [Candidatus Thermoplasmatota archaeon]
MQYVRLGSTGTKVSRLCLGTMGFGSPQWRDWCVGEEQARKVIDRAVDLGITFFDTANMYSHGLSEEILGRALEGWRDDVVLATKVYYPLRKGDPNAQGLSRKMILREMRDSLQRLRTDHVDLYQIHRFDADTPVEETMGALSGLVDEGKARYLGASTMWAWQFAKYLFLADQHGWHRFVTMQNHYNLVYREEEREMLPLCLDQGVGLLPWSPLARGFLTGKAKRTTTTRARSDNLRGDYEAEPASFVIADRVDEVAARKGVTAAQVALAWVLHQPGVTAPILGATKVEHVEEAVAALDVKLTPEERAYLEEPYRARGVSGFYGPVPSVARTQNR